MEMKKIEPRLYQREIITASALREAHHPLGLHRLRHMNNKRVFGVDLAGEGVDQTIITEAIKGKNGDIFIIDEYASLPEYKWYRNPIKWWKWRRLMKVIDAQIAKGKKDGTIWMSSDL